MQLWTTRLRLREITFNDTLAIHQYASLEEVSRYQPWGPNSLEETTEFIAEVVADAAEHNRVRYCLAVEYDGNIIGAGELRVTDGYNECAEIGYVLHPAYWGQGFATEMANVLLAFGFEQLDMHRVFATCDPENIASFKVMEKVGFQPEGRIRDHMRINGGWRDSLIYSMLSDEWQGMVYKYE